MARILVIGYEQELSTLVRHEFEAAFDGSKGTTISITLRIAEGRTGALSRRPVLQKQRL